MINVILVWLALFGVWPTARPEHTLSSSAGIADIIVHLTAIAILSWRVGVWLDERE